MIWVLPWISNPTCIRTFSVRFIRVLHHFQGTTNALRHSNRSKLINFSKPFSSKFSPDSHLGTFSSKFSPDSHLEKADLGYEARHPLHDASAKGHIASVIALLDASSKANSVDNENIYPLQLAAAKGRTSIIRILVERGAGVDATKYKGLTALHMASAFGHKGAVLALLSVGASLEKKTSLGSTALHLAAEQGHLPCVSALIERGAAVNEVDINGNTALHIACLYGKRDVLAALISSGARVEERNAFGQTPLGCAAAAGHTACITLLLSKWKVHVDGDAGTEKGAQVTPLHWAAFRGHKDAMLTLIKHGASVDSRTGQGRTPLHFAARSRSPAAVAALLAHGAPVDAADHDGRTALHEAALSGAFWAADLLVKGGADISLRDGAGRTAQRCATAHSGTVEVTFRLLRERVARLCRALDETPAARVSTAYAAAYFAGCSALLLETVAWFVVDSLRLLALALSRFAAGDLRRGLRPPAPQRQMDEQDLRGTPVATRAGPDPDAGRGREAPAAPAEAAQHTASQPAAEDPARGGAQGKAAGGAGHGHGGAPYRARQKAAGPGGARWPVPALSASGAIVAPGVSAVRPPPMDAPVGGGDAAGGPARDADEFFALLGQRAAAQSGGTAPAAFSWADVRLQLDMAAGGEAEAADEAMLLAALSPGPAGPDADAEESDGGAAAAGPAGQEEGRDGVAGAAAGGGDGGRDATGYC